MKNISFNLIISLAAVLVTLASCVNYDDASRLVDVKVQLLAPKEYKAGATIGEREITLKTGSLTRTAKTDASNIATFPQTMPDVYSISTAWELTGDEYAEKTGSTGLISGYIVTASLNDQPISEAQESEPLKLQATISAKPAIVISKIYSSGSKARPELGGKNYLSGKYFEIYNQSDKDVNVAGLYIGLLDSTNPIPYTLQNLYDDPKILGEKVVVKQVFRIPTDKEYILKGGKSIILTNSAVDHSDVSDYEQDLTNSDFEAVGVNDKLEHNEDVPKLIPVFTSTGGAAIMNLVQGGPCGIIIFDTDENVSTWEKVYGYGKTSGTVTYMLVPNKYIKDGVDFLKNKNVTGPDLATKRLYPEFDASCTHINAISGYSGEVLYRRTASVTPDGRKILMDTNNSINDFKVSTTIKPREYDDNEQ